MSKIVPARITLLTVCLLAAVCAVWRDAQAQPVMNVYEIVAGEYIACCGIAGEIRSQVPNDGQSHVQLVTDATQQSAQMVILSFFDGEPIFLVVENGRLYPGYIEFGMRIPAGGPGPSVPQQHYIVSNSASGIRFSGITVYPIFGADVFNRFAHSNVVANLLPATPVKASIRVASVEICWPSISNRTYQVQYRASIGSNTWENLQAPVPGSGSTQCVVDHVAADQPRRFYRVIPVP
jgi:hypothetical protein